MPRKQRLDPAIFHLPVERMREGYYSDKYFVRARELLRKDHHRPRVTMLLPQRPMEPPQSVIR